MGGVTLRVRGWAAEGMVIAHRMIGYPARAGMGPGED